VPIPDGEDRGREVEREGENKSKTSKGKRWETSTSVVTYRETTLGIKVDIWSSGTETEVLVEAVSSTDATQAWCWWRPP
jgi:hypothetical protein